MGGGSFPVAITTASAAMGGASPVETASPARRPGPRSSRPPGPARGAGWPRTRRQRPRGPGARSGPTSCGRGRPREPSRPSARKSSTSSGRALIVIAAR